LCIFIGIALIYAGIKVIFFKKRNPAFNPEEFKELQNYGFGTTFFKFSLYFSDILAEYLFWTLNGGALIIFTSYKTQMVATLILPEYGHGSEGFYSVAYAIFMITLIFRTISIILSIYE
jgi:hypothetical protein